ncbi:hypothetical protein [Enterobacter hormaechei]
MSYSTVIKVWPGEKSEEDEELRNGWGSGPVIWNDMAMKYLGLPAHQYMMKIDSLWPLANRLDIPYHHRAVLAMTYDRMYVKQEHYALAADCIRKYLTDFPADDKYVNHWPRIAEILKAPRSAQLLVYGSLRYVKTHFLASGMKKSKITNSLIGLVTGAFLMTLTQTKVVSHEGTNHPRA